MQRQLSSDPIQFALASPTLTKLVNMAREVVGVEIAILRPKDGSFIRMYPSGIESPLPKFCQLIRASDDGKNRCGTCRKLVVAGACSSGLSDFCCHGGMGVIAAPVPSDPADGQHPLVVSSCAFAEDDQERGWRSARRQADGLPVDMAALRRAYFSLPVMTDERRRLTRWLVDAAAQAIAEAREHAALRLAKSAGSRDDAPRISTEADVNAQLEEMLQLARDPAFRGASKPTGATLVDLVVGMVNRSPALPYTVQNIAKAARVTPNHLSMLFHRHTGQTFMDFLGAKRVALGQELLRDPTLTVSEVAERAGFSDASYFSRRFKKLVGATPKAWRESLRLM